MKIHNSTPVVSISSHTDGALLLEAVEYSFFGQVSDANHDNGELVVKWTSNTRTLCSSSTPDTSGETICTATLEATDTQIKLQVTDPDGASAIASISIEVQETEPPSIVILSPESTGSYYSDQLISFSAIIQDNEDDPTDLIYEWSSNLDGTLSLNTTPDSDGSISGYSFLSEGQHAISLRVEDTTGKVQTEDLAIVVGGPNSEPTCSITSPLSGEGFVFGQNITFSGIADDVDINNALLSVSWESDVDGVFNTSPPLSDGTLGFTTDLLSLGNHSITLRVEDEMGTICTTGVQLAVGTPPSLTLDTPISGETYNLGSSIFFSGTVSDQEDIASDITLSWNSDIDGEFSTQGSDSNGSIAFGYSNLSAGNHNITIHATDSDGLITTVAQTLNINTPPSQPVVTINPTIADTTNDLTLSYVDSIDVDGDPISYSITWYQNGILTSYTSMTVPASATTVADTWTARVTPNDGYGDGDYGEASISIENALPTITNVSISPTTVYSNSVLTCSATAFDADQTLTPTYEWTVGTSQYSGSTLDLGPLALTTQAQISCTATVIDDQGASASLSTSVTISNQAPSLSSTTITPNSGVYNDSTVTCSTVAYDPDETVTPTFEWHLNGTLVSSGSTLDLLTTAALPNDALECHVQVSDSMGATATDSVSLIIGNRVPTTPTVAISPDPAYGGDDLTCDIITASTDLDGQTVSYNYTWTQNLITTSHTTATVPGSDVGIGEIWECFLTPTDGMDVGTTASDSITTNDPQTDVLIIWDVLNTDTQNLKSALETEGWTVDLSTTTETSYDGTNPAPSGYDVVIHLNGTTYQTEMPVAGQQALVDFVQTGGGFIHMEWNAYEIGEGRMMTMRDITLFDRTSGSNGSNTWNIVSSQSTHPVVANIPTSFAFNSGTNIGYIHNFGSDPATVLMTSSHGDAVAVREWQSGRIVGFAHSGNWTSGSASFGTLSDYNIQQLFINAVDWCH